MMTIRGEEIMDEFNENAKVKLVYTHDEKTYKQEVFMRTT